MVIPDPALLHAIRHLVHLGNWQNDFSKVFIADVRSLKESLDCHSDEQEKLHRQALVKSLAEHEAIRDSAERARLRVEIEITRERRRREEEEQIRLHEARLKVEKEETERQQRELLRVKKIEEEKATRQRQAEAIQQQQQQEALKQQQKEQAEKLQKEQEAKQKAELELKQKQVQEQKLAEEKARAAQAQPKTTTTPTIAPPVSTSSTPPTTTIPSADGWKTLKAHAVLTPQGITSTADQREAEHQRYMRIHKELKEMRKWVLSEVAKQPGLKNQLGDMRRMMKKSLSIFNAVDKSLNKKPTQDIRALLDQAAQIAQPSLAPTQFIVALDGDQSPAEPYPAALLYLMNYFAKFTIQRYVEQVGRDPKAAEPYGILLVSIFTLPAYQYRGHSLIDILWAKYHKVCPVLFGINGNQKTVGGKHRLGWKFEKDSGNTGFFVSAEDHLVNQTGLAVGFASITLRDFSKSRNKNPAPNRMFWTSLARILSTPVAERTDTHYVVLRSMLELYIPRFINFFGGAALAALRKVYKDWPEQAVEKMNPNVLALGGMITFLEKDHDLYL
ncbi:hypothetical protein MRB53_039376 [Persea americana]|nr:hypothetical protein MRB53_039376 [Persea americana]